MTRGPGVKSVCVSALLFPLCARYLISIVEDKM